MSATGDLFVTPAPSRKLGRPALGKRPMSDAERQRRHRKLAKHKAKAVRRQALIEARDARVGALTASLAALDRYGVIYADPPWQFEAWSRETGMDRSAANHYATMPLADIKALPVPAAKDSVCFLWVTVPMLPQGIEVLAAWGFTYRSAAGWIKDRDGTGFWFRNRLELLLVGTRGHIPAPAMGDQPPQLIVAPRRRHSQKPEPFAAMIERLYPTLPKLEMFARRARAGWHCWGNEIERGHD